MKVVEVNINKLKPSQYNPRIWDDKTIGDIGESIKRFGIVDPIIANSAPQRQNIVIGGHLRLRVAKDLGYKKISVVYVNLPNIKKEKELNLRLNRNLGKWDWDLLKKFDEELLKDIGFENEELDQIFGLDIVDEFDVEKELEKVLAGKERRCKEGDLFGMGKYYICPNCKKEIDEKEMLDM